MSVLIREAERSDLDDLLTLYTHLNPSDPPLQRDRAERVFAEMRTREGLSLLVAVLDERLVGSVTLVMVPNLTRGGLSYALVENVVTHDDYRRRGTGRSLLAEAAKRAEEAGCYKLMLMTGRSEAHVRAFYTDCGFRQDKVGFQIRFDGR